MEAAHPGSGSPSISLKPGTAPTSPSRAGPARVGMTLPPVAYSMSGRGYAKPWWRVGEGGVMPQPYGMPTERVIVPPVAAAGVYRLCELRSDDESPRQRTLHAPHTESVCNPHRQLATPQVPVADRPTAVTADARPGSRPLRDTVPMRGELDPPSHSTTPGGAPEVARGPHDRSRRPARPRTALSPTFHPVRAMRLPSGGGNVSP